MLASPPARQVSDGFERELMAALRQTAPAPRTVAWWERFRLRFEWRLRMPAMVAAGSLAAAVCAAVVVPRVAERQQERKVFLSATVQRYHELERADSDVNYEAVDSSVELSTGTLLRE
jgi:hypothetical protein